MDAIADHLWQSTWFALAAGLLAFFVRKDAARVRYWIWLAASLKFLVPFSLLTWIGGRFIFQVADEDALLPLVQHVVQPLTGTVISIEPIGGTRAWVLFAVWMLGAVSIGVRWVVHSWRAQSLVVRSEACELLAPIPVLQSREVLEPCVVGIRRPVLLLPIDLASTLSPQQLWSVIAHETWHVRRHDNLTAALHAITSAMFWFHPLVWWIGRKLVDTREHACDEGAIDEGNEPVTYAEAILRVCESSVQSRVACVARAAGGDLKARLRCIMSTRPAARFPQLRRAIACCALVSFVALPVAAGMTVVSLAQLQVAAGTRSIRISDGGAPSFANVDTDHVYARNVSLRELIGHAYGIDARDVGGRYHWLDVPRYDVDLRAEAGASDARQLVKELMKQQFNIDLVVRPALVGTTR